MPCGSHHQACNCPPPGWLCLVPAPLQDGLLAPLLGGSHVDPPAMPSGYPILNSQRTNCGLRLLDMALVRVSSHQARRAHPSKTTKKSKPGSLWHFSAGLGSSFTQLCPQEHREKKSESSLPAGTHFLGPCSEFCFFYLPGRERC